MKRIYAYLTAFSFSLSLIAGVAIPARAEQTPVVIQFFYRLFNTNVEKANQLLVITEDWCRPCRELHPHLKQLKKEGYNVHTYTKSEWSKAKGKPSGLPEVLLPDNRGRTHYSIPVVLYVQARTVNGDWEYEVVRSHYGGKDVEYIKRYLTK